MSASALPFLELSPVIPVVTLPEAALAIELAGALAAGGVPIVEVTLRSPAAWEGIAAIRDALPAVAVGAGTVWTADQLDRAIDAGARFAVSPGAPPALLEHSARRAFPLLAGAQTATEIAALRDAGAEAVKFFPAQPAGGARAVAALSAVFPGLAFCPTGGIDADNAGEYLGLPCVPCVGGSWLAPRDALSARDWRAVEARAQEAVARWGRA
ncbi:MAG TPA: bifunctional 4-hydroxy-2-oxoglutarate aldolase/2-dehydro-3-deoxy-phosphogluconate aldolase [Thermoanaerobaculia bacterium]|nr:bifunctional 4-hydroxy-2-oxoglutarate aldolase/2-dehydro-3-deoxy-phosphogluconate aldolase [Thermoanaerobaculia bacterium]